MQSIIKRYCRYCRENVNRELMQQIREIMDLANELEE